MGSVTRRRAVRVLGACLVGGSAGCTAFGRDAREFPELYRLRASNSDTRPHTVHVVLLEDGEPVYWDSGDLQPREDGVVDSVTFEGYPTDAAPYVLHARIDEQPRSEWRTVEFATFDQPCLSLDLEIGDEEPGAAGELSVLYGIEGDGCLPNPETPTETASRFRPRR